MKQHLYAERRQHIRSALGATIHATPLPRQFLASDLELVAEDISEHGLRLASPERIPVDSELLLELDMDTAQPPIRVVAKVVWVKQGSTQDQCRIGVEFSDATDSSIDRLRGIVSRQLNQA
jgi:hypothetical protein